MTTIDVGTLYVDNPKLQNRSTDEIRAFLTQILESDLITNIPFKKKSRWEEVDRELRSLKIVNETSAKELEKSFEILANEAQKSGMSDYKSARDEYLTDKYARWI